MEDRRKSERFRAIDYATDDTKYVKQYFKISDGTTDKSMGYLINISPRGMMILSKSSVREDHTYRLRIELPEEVRGCDHLMIEARSVWCEKNVDSDFYRVGFSFVSAYPYHEEIIQLLFNRDESGETESSRVVASVSQKEDYT